MKEIGVQKNPARHYDLHENIALSMADVLTFNTSIFVKQYGRATALDGGVPRYVAVAHAGDVERDAHQFADAGHDRLFDDPSYFIDDASLLHGTSSVNETGGGLGGAVKLSTRPADADGFQPAIHAGCRLVFDFRRVFAPHLRQRPLANFDTRRLFLLAKRLQVQKLRIKNVLILDDDQHHRLYYPIERNKSGACHHDFHALQEVYYNTGHGDRFGLQAWVCQFEAGTS